eukprot:6120704-Pyramimonas_sp.AAC.2
MSDYQSVIQRQLFNSVNTFAQVLNCNDIVMKQDTDAMVAPMRCHDAGAIPSKTAARTLLLVGVMLLGSLTRGA